MIRHPGALLLLLILSTSGCAGAPEDARLADRAYRELTQGFILQAEMDCLAALAINPDNAYALINLGMIYGQTGRPDKARECFEKVIRLDPVERPGKAQVEADLHKPLSQIAQENLKSLP